MKKSGLTLVLFGLLLGFGLPTTSAHAQATRTWVSGVGDDANPCSRTAPCKTFAGAISKTAAGGEIDCLDPGGFGGVTITKSMTIDCGTLPGGILNAGNVNGVVVNTAAASDKVILRNLVINGTVSTSPGPGLNGIRWINLGLELHLDRVVITGDTTLAVDVNKTSTGFLYVRNSYFTEVPSGISLASSNASFVIATIENSYLAGMTGNCVVASGANTFANVNNSIMTNCGTGASATTSGTHLSVSNSLIANSVNGISAVSGAVLRTVTNVLTDNTTGISAVGASWQTSGDNKVAGGTTTSSGTSTAIPLR
jgi:hypothetical protein